MRHLLQTASALVMLTSAAAAGDNSCAGKVTVGPEWTTVPCDNYSDAAPRTFARFKTKSKLGHRILRKCPAGSVCGLSLSIHDNPKDHRVEGKFMTVVKWPANGVERLD
jgi:hypothetical protein